MQANVTLTISRLPELVVQHPANDACRPACCPLALRSQTALLQLCAAGRRRGSMPAAPHGKPAGQGHGQREGQDQGQAGSWEDAARGLTVPEQLAAAARLLDSGVSPNVANRVGGRLAGGSEGVRRPVVTGRNRYHLDLRKYT